MRTTLVLLMAAGFARADLPGAAYVFPAGGQRGTTVDVRIGGLNLHDTARLHVDAAGVTATPVIELGETVWFEGPLIRQPASQRKEEYPRDYRGRFTIAATAPATPVRWAVSNSQGVTSSRAFVVGDLPEIVEREIEGDAIPVAVDLPVTINGRIFPREDVDVWTIALDVGETVTCEVNAARIGSPLDSRIEVRGPDGRRVAENIDALGNDSRLTFTAAAQGTHSVRIHDVAFDGLQSFVYRLTLTSGPWIEAVHPLGGRRGETTRFETFGANLPAEPLAIAIPDTDAEFVDQPIRIGDVPAGTLTLDLGDAPEYRESTPGEDTFTIPATLNGHIAPPGETDDWTFPATKGEQLVFDLRAAALGSPLDSVLTVVDATGRTLGTSDDRATGHTDSLLRFTAPADGEYALRVAERLRSRGGPRFAYRIHAREDTTEPGVSLAFPGDAIVVTRGEDTSLKLAPVRLGGYQGPIEIRFDGLPEGVMVEGATIAASKTKGTLVLRTVGDVPVQVAEVTATAVLTIDEAEVSVPVTSVGPSGESVTTFRVAVAIPTPFRYVNDYATKYANMGCVHTRTYRLERTGYDGPVRVRLADVQARHLQGVTGGTHNVPAGAMEFTYSAQLGPRMEIGRTCRICLMATATVTDFDGSEHDVCFSSTAQNEQFVLLTDPPRLYVAPDRRSIAATPNATVRLPIRVKRGIGLAGPVALTTRLAVHVRDVEIEASTLDPDDDAGDLVIEFGPEPGPFNGPLVVRATTRDDRGHPVISETSVEIVAP